MNLFQSILLGIVQGLTEFIPVSSSGHLVIVPYLFGWKIPTEDAFIFNVLVQVATLLGVFAYFWRDLRTIAQAFTLSLFKRQPFADPQARMGWYIILATIPAGLIGLAIKDIVEKAFASPFASAWLLLVTAVLLLVAEKAGKRNRRLEQISWGDALWIGFFQAMAIFPGVSRSGSTIVGGMTRNFDRSSAARFSFLISIPIMLAAGLLAGMDLFGQAGISHKLPVYLPGFITAAITGYLAIRWLLNYLTRHPLYIFSIYCVFLALATITLHIRN